ncbi:MAG: bifunctional DNA-formamidopyrimidine glycosylase/DNA-(apurinic or apyrimidinic site) lyase [Desulfurivibrionaceae bacterium]|nr:bifunctional DNA-formamidopyrimidine glycosylase/DNA-(apurinic or apyrimidinic site) lyase [Desulfobulbales bacterium]MDT8335122.1 bifunctional DNA-formamidopyrimidine glycosylase/DNA-(apurinic or apyrimidinic site) lyase [Desulfurivibrionaceae bacterium]
MPELPEVEVICRGLAPLIEGRRLESVALSKQRLRLPAPGKAALALVAGQKISRVQRRAKYIVIGMENSAAMIIHLGMTGRLGIFPEGTPLLKHDHLRWLLDNKMELRFNDTRRFGSLRIIGPGGDLETLFGDQGPDPFQPGYSAEYLAEKGRGRKLPVKNFLMDNRIVTGIGNIYACETLFAARINPKTPAGALKLKEWRTIVENSRQILEEAIACGGSSISDYVNSSGEKGYFQVRLRVYGRLGEPCRTCGKPVEKYILGGRASFFCPGCQPEKG